MHQRRSQYGSVLPLFCLLLASACSGDDAAESGPPERDSGREPQSDASTASDAGDAGGDAGSSAAARASISPVTGGLGVPFTASNSSLELAEHGYSEAEFFIEGSATAYALQGEMTLDGQWDVAEADMAEYKSRFLVRRPMDAADFNGTVVVEWLNVSGGVDADPGFRYNWEEYLREGYVWVGVSAQRTGIEGGGFSVLEDPPPALKAYDPERYGSLSHPGDAYSFDIYNQVAEVLLAPGPLNPLGGLEPARLIAYGESQSAMRMVTYVNAVHPRVLLYDGFFIHSRGGSSVPLTNVETLSVGGPPVHIRGDLDEPVFQFQTETDLFGLLAFLPARQPDTDRLRTWEVAGTAHADTRVSADAGDLLPCTMVNDGPQHFVIKAALHALVRWVEDGTEPPDGEALMTDDAGAPVADEHGNTRGGIRSPDVDVPIATHSGLRSNDAGGILCLLFGETTPFTPEKLAELYPTHADYVEQVTASARAARDAGFLLAPEEAAMVEEAEAAAVPE